MNKSNDTKNNMGLSGYTEKQDILACLPHILIVQGFVKGNENGKEKEATKKQHKI